MSHLPMEVLLSLREPGLEPGDAAAREHLDSCELCRTEFDRLHQRIARLKALPTLRPPRDQWPAVARRVRAVRSARRLRLAGLAGLAAAASVALALVLGSSDQGNPLAEREITLAMERSQALEQALRGYNPEARVLDGQTARIAEELENRIARVDRELERAELQAGEVQTREDQLLRLWRERVGLLDALVDVHVTRASQVGL